MNAAKLYKRMRAEEPQRKQDDAGEEDHQGLPVRSPTDRGPQHGQTVVTTIVTSVLFSIASSSWFDLDRGICHGILMFAHFGPLLLAYLIHYASKITSTHMLWA